MQDFFGGDKQHNYMAFQGAIGIPSSGVGVTKIERYGTWFVAALETL